MINRLLFWLTGHLPCRLINRPSQARYLERYYLGRWFGVTFYIHRFVANDGDVEVHNHPWGWSASVILTGGYAEEVVADLMPAAAPSGCITTLRTVRWFNYIPGNHFHRIAWTKPCTWTLFFHGSRVTIRGRLKGWGFLRRVREETVFTQYPPGDLAWYLTARPGRAVGRAGLNFPRLRDPTGGAEYTYTIASDPL